MSQVDQIRVGWGEFFAAVGHIDDVFDIYIRESGVLAWESEDPPGVPDEDEGEGTSDSSGRRVTFEDEHQQISVVDDWV